MKRVAAVVLVALGVLLVALGLLFLAAAGAKGYRYVIAVVGLGAGAVATGFGVRLWRRAEAETPEGRRRAAVLLARQHGGEVPEELLRATFGAAADAAIPALVRAGGVRRDVRGEGVFYVFEALVPRLAVRRCDYCHTEVPLATGATSCAVCGGPLRVTSAPRADAKDAYGMD